MTTTPAARPSWQGQPPQTTLRQQLLALLPDPLVFNTATMMPGQTNLAAAADAFKAFGIEVTQGDLDTEAKRRTEANRDPRATPSPGAFTKAKPGDQGRAMAAQRFGTKK